MKRRKQMGWIVSLALGAGLALGLVMDAPATVIVSGGTLAGLGTDTVVTDASLYANFGPHGGRFDAGPGHTTASAYLDMGTYHWVSQLAVLNRNVTTLLQMYQANLAVAANEAAPGFSASNPSSYTVSLGGGVPGPGTTDASVWRTLNLSRPVYRRYLALTGMNNGNVNTPIDFGDINVAGSAPAGHVVSAGTIMAQAGTDLVEDQHTVLGLNGFQASDGNGDNTIRLLLDLGTVKFVNTLQFVNRLDAISNYGVGSLNVWAAADESASGFDPQLFTSFGMEIGSGTPTPVLDAIGTIRDLSIAAGSHRYLLLEFTGNLNGAFSGGTGSFQVGDINAFAVPEPGTVGLLAVGGCLLAWRRSRK